LMWHLLLGSLQPAFVLGGSRVTALPAGEHALLRYFDGFHAVQFQPLVDQTSFRLDEFLSHRGPYQIELLRCAADHRGQPRGLRGERADIPCEEKQVGVGAALGEGHMPRGAKVIVDEKWHVRQTSGH